MATLQELKPHIDQGACAQLVLLHPRIIEGREIEVGSAVSVSRTLAGYQWQLDYVAKVENQLNAANKQNHNFGPDWEAFLKRIEGIQTQSDQWELLLAPAAVPETENR